MQTGQLCNLEPVETGLNNRKRLVDGSVQACEFLCLKCLHLKSKNVLKYSNCKWILQTLGVFRPHTPYYLRAGCDEMLRNTLYENQP